MVEEKKNPEVRREKENMGTGTEIGEKGGMGKENVNVPEKKTNLEEE